MKENSFFALYNKYYKDRADERLGLFELIARQFNIQRALYAGSFVHVAPSFVISDVVYVDSDRQAKQAFANLPEIIDFISARKQYEPTPQVVFHGESYTSDFGEPKSSFDLLISQYAGFVSLHCKRYLKIGGILLVNNSHGDASMAYLDKNYALRGVIAHRGGRYKLIDKDLDSYFVPKKPEIKITREFLEQHQRGIGYINTASAYVFERT